MRKLKIPLKDVDQETIYNTCAGNFRDNTALKYMDKVVLSAAAYEKYIPRDIVHFPNYDIDEEDEKKVKNVYDEKFAKTGSVGKKYYESIMANANGRCPICGRGKLKNLDHFLPKALYPLLCVTPANLIPVCRDCNFDKGTAFDTDYYSIPFNPYFDDMDEIWLECKINYKEDNTYDITYINGYDKSIDEKKWNKYETHLKVFDLNETFGALACDEIENCKYEYTNLFKECGINIVKDRLIEHKESCEMNDVNSWQSALYRELTREVEDYCSWLDKR